MLLSWVISCVQTTAAALPTTSQRSEVEGAGKSARFGNPKHSYTIATKRALALRLPHVLGTLAQLGTVQDTPLSELLSAHLGSTLRTLVVETRECRCIPC
jgi:chromosome segregation ATPase